MPKIKNNNRRINTHERINAHKRINANKSVKNKKYQEERNKTVKNISKKK